jgi:glutamate synthase (NADPH/NADH) large chain
VILGPVGTNFAAGMSGGMAFIHDPDDAFEHVVNPDTVVWQRIATPYWDSVVKDLVAEHVATTQSRFGETLLLDWDRQRLRFWQVVPKEMLTLLSQPLTEELAVAAAGE